MKMKKRILGRNVAKVLTEDDLCQATGGAAEIGVGGIRTGVAHHTCSYVCHDDCHIDIIDELV